MISIVITFYDNVRILALCLSRMWPTLRGLDVEVIVVDDNPAHPVMRRALGPRAVRVVRSPTNAGYSGACNLGVDAARGEKIVFVDSDIVPTNGWLTGLLAAESDAPDAFGVGATILDLSTGGITAYGSAIHSVDTVHPYRGNAVGKVPIAGDRRFAIVPSGTLLMRRELFVRAGGFDETFRNAFCDFDLCMRLRRVAAPGLVTLRSIVYHRGAVSGTIRHAHYADTKALFFRKWGAEIPDDGLTFLERACQTLHGSREAKPYLAVNLSSSLFWQDYVDTAASALDMRIAQTYSFPAVERNASHTRIEDHLDWELCRQRIPILYFVDRFSSLRANHFWFSNRATRGDIVIDRNGNAVPVARL